MDAEVWDTSPDGAELVAWLLNESWRRLESWPTGDDVRSRENLIASDRWRKIVFAMRGLAGWPTIKDNDKFLSGIQWVVLVNEWFANPPSDTSVKHADALEVFRDVWGNPFRHVSGLDVANAAEWFESNGVRHWLTRDVVAIAKRMSDVWDFADMGILGDALQDAGCEDQCILEHCRKKCRFCQGKFAMSENRWHMCGRCFGRGHTLHVKGCWVVDMILGAA